MSISASAALRRPVAMVRALGALWSRIVAVPPERYSDTLLEWRARTLRALLLFGIACCVLPLPYMIAERIGPLASVAHTVVASLATAAGSVVLFWLAGRGDRGLTLAGWLMLPFILGMSIGGSLMSRGIFSPYTLQSFSALLLAALVLGRRAMLINLVILLLGFGLLGWLTEHGLIPGAAQAIQPGEARLHVTSMASTLGLVTVLLYSWDRAHRQLLAMAVESARLEQAALDQARTLVEIDRAKTDFFRRISHEFRTPVTLSMGAAEQLLSEAEPLSAPQRQAVELIRRNDRRLHRLINTLLHFAAVEAGRVEAVFEPLDLARFTRELAAEFQSAMDAAGLRYTVDCAPLGEDVYVDREMWEKIVLNLLSNALKFTLRGEVALSLRVVSDRVELAVRDSGAGIAPGAQRAIFDMFHREPATEARTQEGSGIGLALVQELARLHGGAIRVDSAQGQGSTFTVSLHRGAQHLPEERIGRRPPAPAGLPAAPFLEEAQQWLGAPPPEPQSAAPPAELPSRSSRSGRVALGGHNAGHIVLVEDSRDMRDYLQSLLAQRFAVEAYADAASALLAMRARPPALVLSDVMLPGADGYELLRQIRADGRLAQVPVLLLSARAAEEDALEGLEQGADDYLRKPFSARELVARVGAHMQLGALRREVVTAKDLFMSTISHELRGPLTAVKGYAQLAQGRLHRSGAPEAQMLDRLVQGIGRMEKLVDDITDVARLESGRLTLERRECDLTRLCAEAADAREAASGRRITRALPERPVTVLGDASRLVQILTNLLTNAIKYSAPETPVTLSLRADGADVEVAVRDEGVGIAPEHLPRIGDCFYRVPAPVGRQAPSGTGVGLYVCRELLERLGGALTIESEPGVGSTFKVRLPRAPDAAPR